MSRSIQLIEQACAATGLQDFGEDSFRDGLERLVASVDTEARLSDKGKVAFDRLMLSRLTTRLRIEDWYARHPEIDEQQIIAPLIGLGLPRTGSTAMFHLLSMDPAVRTIRSWESMDPCPAQLVEGQEDPRIALAEQAMAHRNKVTPRKQTMLPSTARSPTECGVLMSFDFKTQFFQSLVWVPSYSHWVMNDADLVPTYQYLKRVLKLLQWQRPPIRWRLKSPSHSQFIGDLFKVFPDARFWMTHRDVERVIPSVADLYFEQHTEYCDTADMRAIGRFNEECWELAMKKMIAFRDAGNEQRFFDVYFTPFQKDPFPVLADLYRWLGEDLSDDALTRMRAWRESTPRGKHGQHDYAATDFGIDTTALQNRFRFYSTRFPGVAA